jgi:hypothetical protein
MAINRFHSATQNLFAKVLITIAEHGILKSRRKPKMQGCNDAFYSLTEDLSIFFSPFMSTLFTLPVHNLFSVWQIELLIKK